MFDDFINCLRLLSKAVAFSYKAVAFIRNSHTKKSGRTWHMIVIDVCRITAGVTVERLFFMFYTAISYVCVQIVEIYS